MAPALIKTYLISNVDQLKGFPDWDLVMEEMIRHLVDSEGFLIVEARRVVNFTVDITGDVRVAVDCLDQVAAFVRELLQK